MLDPRDLLLIGIPLIPAVWANVRQGQTRKDRKKVTEFEAVFNAQKTLVDNCEQRCSRMEQNLKDRDQSHAVELLARDDKHRIELKEWQRKFLESEGRAEELQQRLEWIEGFLRRQGFHLPPESERDERRPPRRREGES